jgi:hypothetical protein
LVGWKGGRVEGKGGRGAGGYWGRRDGTGDGRDRVVMVVAVVMWRWWWCWWWEGGGRYGRGGMVGGHQEAIHEAGR